MLIGADMTVDVMQLDNLQQQQLNTTGTSFGLKQQDFMDLISRDLQEAEELRQVKQHQDEKALLSVGSYLTRQFSPRCIS